MSIYTQESCREDVQCQQDERTLHTAARYQGTLFSKQTEGDLWGTVGLWPCSGGGTGVHGAATVPSSPSPRCSSFSSGVVGKNLP